MIESFSHRGLKRLYEKGDGRGISPDLVDTVERILDLPRYRLHALKGDLKGYWAVTVRANWRIIFRFEDGNANGVELIDYH